MNTSAEAFLTDWKASLPKLRAGAPDVARAFGGLHAAVMKDGVAQKDVDTMMFEVPRQFLTGEA